MDIILSFKTCALAVFLVACPPLNKSHPATAQDRSGPDERIKVARVAIDWVREEHFVQPPPTPELDTFRIDRNAVAIVEPGGDAGYAGGRPDARTHAKATARAMGVPFDTREAFLNCTDPEPRTLRKCSFRRGVESLFRFEDLTVEGDDAQIQVAWSFIMDQDLTTHRYTLRLKRASDGWTVQEVLRRELQ